MTINAGARLVAAHDEVFPKGALVLSVEPVTELQSAEDRRKGRPVVPQLDKINGKRIYAVTVIDQSAERKADAVATVKIAADVQPIPPAPIPGTTLAPVIFDGLTITPWVDDKLCNGNRNATGQHKCRARQAYSLRATGMRPAIEAPATGRRTTTAAAAGGASVEGRAA
jgi:hypothetical protein